MAPKRRAEGAGCVFLGKTRKEWKRGKERQMRETMKETWKRYCREEEKNERNGKKIEKGERNADAEGKTCRRR